MERGPGGEANRLHTAPQALSHDTLYTRLPKRSIDFAPGGSRNRDHCKGGDPCGQCHSNKENLLTSLTGMKWADKIFPGFGLVWKEKRHILVLLDEKAGTGGFDDA